MMTGLLYTDYEYLKMIKPSKSLDELYAFFVPNIIKPPQKPHCICSGIQLDRAGWHIEIYSRPIDDALIMWFYPHPNRGPKWAMSYDKFENPSQDS